jgi:hypothetical protein
VMRCLRKEPSERFATAGELSAALRSVHVQTSASPTLLFDGAAKATPLMAPSAPSAGRLTTEAVSRTHPPSPRPRARRLGVPAVIGASALTIGGAATWALLEIRGPATAVNDVAPASSSGPQRPLPPGSLSAQGSVLPPVQLPSATTQVTPSAPASAPPSAPASAPAPTPASSPSLQHPPSAVARPRSTPPLSRPEPPEEIAAPTAAPVPAAPHNPLDLPHLQ